MELPLELSKFVPYINYENLLMLKQYDFMIVPKKYRRDINYSYVRAQSCGSYPELGLEPGNNFCLLATHRRINAILEAIKGENVIKCKFHVKWLTLNHPIFTFSQYQYSE